MDETVTLDVARAESQKAFAAGDFETANAYLRKARELVGDGQRVVQMGDGELQIVPVEP